jgi:Uma2 family endonuclease
MAEMPLVGQKILTEADLLRLGAQDVRFEVIDGEIVEMSPVGVQHSDICGNVYDVLKPFARANQLDEVRMDGLIFVLQADSEKGIRKTRIPDISFVRKGRLPKDFDRSRPFPGAPDLAVEVVSPDESADDLLAKIRDYFTYGTEEVWVLYGGQKELHRFIRGENGSHIYTEADVLSSPVFPGLSVRIADLFAQPAE